MNNFAQIFHTVMKTEKKQITWWCAVSHWATGTVLIP